jgi:TonB family protein
MICQEVEMAVHRILATLVLAVVLAACGTGQKLLKEVEPIESAPPIAQAFDETIAVSIDRVIVRNSKGAWASDADWDEYLIRVRAAGPVTIRQVAVFDALDLRRPSLTNRGELIDASRDVETRYGQSGQLVKTQGAGWAAAGGVALVGAGVLASAASVAGPALAASYGTTAAAASGAAATGAGLLLVGGVLIGSAVVRAVNNSRVNDEIQRRQTRFPLALAAGGEAQLDVFLPMAPLPRGVEIEYADARGEHRLRLDTGLAMAEMHRPIQPSPLVSNPEPRWYPEEAARAGIESGWVKARLSVDASGTPRSVSFLEVSHPGYFEDEAMRTLRRWRYTMSDSAERDFEVRLDFRR